jgi:hypothetical protein
MASKVYRAIETAVVFRDSSGTVVMTLQNLAAGAGRVSAQHDRGAGSLAQLHEVTAVFQMETAGVVGESIEVYLFESDGTYQDGTVGTSDAALTADKRRNGMLVGAVIVDTTSTATNIVARFKDVPITSQYYSVGVWNATADNLEDTANASRIIVTPTPPELQ